MTPSLNSQEFLPTMADVAREAGALLMTYFRQNVKVEYKGEADLVTVADRKSEALILFSAFRWLWTTRGSGSPA
jgi:fructose-1,6-bisphosphatase/inositol monophosphatase family enzyme